MRVAQGNRIFCQELAKWLNVFAKSIHNYMLNKNKKKTPKQKQTKRNKKYNKIPYMVHVHFCMWQFFPHCKRVGNQWTYFQTYFLSLLGSAMFTATLNLVITFRLLYHNFGTQKEGSQFILASSKCHSCKNMFQNSINALSKLVDAFLSKSSTLI